jgi:translation initiation factor IF-3
VPEVRLIGDDGSQVGVLKIDDALRYAQERDLDLVEVAPEAKPPVCRVLDYSKYKYEQAQKLKQARKHQQQITIREIKFRPKIAQHDYDTKKGHVERFLRHKDKVKVTIMFRGREVTHPERGVMILDRLAEELAELAIVEQRPIQDGRNMTMMLGPSKAVLAGTIDSDAAADGAPEQSATDGAPVETSADGAAAAPAARVATPSDDGRVPAPAAEVPAAEVPAAEAPAVPVAADGDRAESAPAEETAENGVPASQVSDAGPSKAPAAKKAKAPAKPAAKAPAKTAAKAAKAAKPAKPKAAKSSAGDSTESAEPAQPAPASKAS